MASQHFPKSVTQARLEQHEDEFERLASELTKSKQTGKQSIAAVYENIGELRMEMDSLEARERQTRVEGDKSKEIIEAQAAQIETLTKAYASLTSVMNDEIGRLRKEYSNDLSALQSTTTDLSRSLSSTSSRLSDSLAETSGRTTRMEDEVERVRGQTRQHRLEVDDVRRQSAVLSDLQTALTTVSANQRELAAAVGGLQQSSLYLSEWVQTLRSEAADLRAIAATLQAEQGRGARALAADVATLAEDIAGVRARSSHLSSEFEVLRGELSSAVEEVAGSTKRQIDAERLEVQALLESVKGAMRRQSEHSQHIMGSLHAGQQRISTDANDRAGELADKVRLLEGGVVRLESALSLKVTDLERGLQDHVALVKRHMAANDQAVRLVSDMMGPPAGRGGGGGRFNLAGLGGDNNDSQFSAPRQHENGGGANKGVHGRLAAIGEGFGQI